MSFSSIDTLIDCLRILGILLAKNMLPTTVPFGMVQFLADVFLIATTSFFLLGINSV